MLGNNKIIILVYKCYLNCRVKEIVATFSSVYSKRKLQQILYIGVLILLNKYVNYCKMLCFRHSALLKPTHPYFPKPVLIMNITIVSMQEVN